MKANREFEEFNIAMDKIIRADPKVVKAAMEAEKEANAKKRRAKASAKKGDNARKE
jgi:hypothetical protein